MPSSRKSGHAHTHALTSQAGSCGSGRDGPGGGQKCPMHASRIVAAAELIIGLVEIRARVIPAWGGTRDAPHPQSAHCLTKGAERCLTCSASSSRLAWPKFLPAPRRRGRWVILVRLIGGDEPRSPAHRGQARGVAHARAVIAHPCRRRFMPPGAMPWPRCVWAST